MKKLIALFTVVLFFSFAAQTQDEDCQKVTIKDSLIGFQEMMVKYNITPFPDLIPLRMMIEDMIDAKRGLKTGQDSTKLDSAVNNYFVLQQVPGETPILVKVVWSRTMSDWDVAGNPFPEITLFQKGMNVFTRKEN